MNPIQKTLLSKISKEFLNYRLDRYRLYEDCSDLIKVIEIQFINLPNEKKAFTINFGVYVPVLYKILWGQDKPKSIEASICTFFCNINDILNEFKGKSKVRYWDIEDLEKLFSEIVEISRKNLYPFSQKINSIHQLNKLMNELSYPAKYVATYPILWATLKIVLREYEEFEILIEELKKRDAEYYLPQINDMILKAEKNGYLIR